MHSYTELGADVKSLPCRWSMDGEAGADVHSNVREFLRIEGKGTQLKYVGESVNPTSPAKGGCTAGVARLGPFGTLVPR